MYITIRAVVCESKGLDLARRTGEGRHHCRVVDEAVVARSALSATEEVHLLPHWHQHHCAERREEQDGRRTGTKMTFDPAVLAILCSASSWRIWIAALELRMSAASRMRRAESTSAWAAMTLASPRRRCWAAEESEAWSSGGMRTLRVASPSVVTAGKREEKCNALLEQDVLDLDAPALRNRLDKLLNLARDGLAFSQQRLEVAPADNVAKGRLSALNEGLADVGDSKRGLVRVDDVLSEKRGPVSV